MKPHSERAAENLQRAFSDNAIDARATFSTERVFISSEDVRKLKTFLMQVEGGPYAPFVHAILSPAGVGQASLSADEAHHTATALSDIAAQRSRMRCTQFSLG